MEEIIPYLQEQIKLHPGMQPEDIIKLCYQAAYGGDHLLLDIGKAEAYFIQEYQAVQPIEEPLYELISPNMARVNLRAWKQAGIPGVWLFRLFTLSVQVPAPGNLAVYLNEAEQLNFPEFHNFRVAYEREGCGSVHHSETYRQAEKPAYRVVNRRLLPLIPILKKAAFVRGAEPHVLAIDGRAASGKTTVSEQLAYILEGTVIHMDHFFLPLELRTQARLDAPGGNIHYERFKAEVAAFLGLKEPFSYRPFNCTHMDYDVPILVPVCPWRIVEGSYSLHPAFGTYYDVAVFSSVTPEEQIRRIRARDGEEMLRVFRQRWIPMEERYFNTFDISGRAAVQFCVQI